MADAGDSWELRWAQSIRSGDPLLFATGVLGFKLPGQAAGPDDLVLEPWQVTALKKYRKAWRNRMTRPGRISIRSGHGTGKTSWLCIIILFTLFAGGRDTKIPVVANSLDQLRDGLWVEANKWINRLPPALRDEVDWQKEKICIKSAPEDAFAVRRTASQHRPEALQGIHARTVLAVFEEASGVPEETIEAGAGSLSTPGAIAVAVGNPTRASGFFHRTHTDPRLMGVWDRMTVSSEDVPRARGHIDDVIRLYGKDSNKYRVRVLGLPPTKDDDTVISLELAEAAKGREVAISHVYPVWGCDPARFGDDRTVLVKRQGNTLLGVPLVWRNLDGGQVAGRIIAEYLRTLHEDRPRAICVDSINVGTSVVDFLVRDGALSADDVNIVKVNVSERPANDDNHHRLRDELWFAGRKWFADLDVSIPTADLNHDQLALIDELIGELTTPTFDLTAAGKRLVMTKAEMKKEIGRSPDIADAFLLTFAVSEYSRPSEDADRHRARRWRDQPFDPLAA